MLQVAGKIRQKFRLRALKSWFGRDRAIGLLLLLLLIGIRSWDPSAVQVLRFKTFDFYQNLQPRVVPDGGLPYCGGCRVVIVDIDEKLKILENLGLEHVTIQPAGPEMEQLDLWMDKIIEPFFR